jgi:hypothetical protein
LAVEGWALIHYVSLKVFVPFFLTAGGSGGTDCWNEGEPLLGPDVLAGDLREVANFASFNGVEAFALGAACCNVGSANLLFQSNTAFHPVFVQNLYRLKDGRFEQIGQSWAFHTFFALSHNLCGCTCVGQPYGQLLGVGCSTPCPP